MTNYVFCYCKLSCFLILLFSSISFAQELPQAETQLVSVLIPRPTSRAYLCPVHATFPTSKSVVSLNDIAQSSRNCFLVLPKSKAESTALTHKNTSTLYFTDAEDTSLAYLHFSTKQLHRKFLDETAAVLLQDNSKSEAGNKKCFETLFRLERSQLVPSKLRQTLLRFVVKSFPKVLVARRFLLTPFAEQMLQLDCAEFDNQFQQFMSSPKDPLKKFLYLRHLLHKKTISAADLLLPADRFHELYADATVLSPALFLTAKSLTPLSAAWFLCVADSGKGVLTIYDDLSAKYQSSYGTTDHFRQSILRPQKQPLVEFRNQQATWHFVFDTDNFSSSFTKLSAYATELFSSLWSLSKDDFSENQLHNYLLRYRASPTRNSLFEEAAFRRDLIYASLTDSIVLALYSTSCFWSSCSADAAFTYMRSRLQRSIYEIYYNTADQYTTAALIPLLLPMEYLQTNAASCSTFGIFQAAILLTDLILQQQRLNELPSLRLPDSDFETIFAHDNVSNASHTWSWSATAKKIYEHGFSREPIFGLSQPYAKGFRNISADIDEFVLLSCRRVSNVFSCTSSITKRPLALRQEHQSRQQLQELDSIARELSLSTMTRRIYK